MRMKKAADDDFRRRVGATVRRLRLERGWTLKQLAERLGTVDSTALGRKEVGKISIKPPEQRQIAQAFGLTYEDFLARVNANVRTSGAPGIPVINRAPAGQIVDYEEYGVDSGQGFEYLDWGGVHDELAFAVVVVGDSMEPGIREGDYLVLSSLNVPEPKVRFEDGKIVFVRFAEESRHRGCTLARAYKVPDGGGWRLQKDNPKYPPVFCADVEIGQFAVAIEHRRKL